jgi:hypothetical protein
VGGNEKIPRNFFKKSRVAPPFFITATPTPTPVHSLNNSYFSSLQLPVRANSILSVRTLLFLPIKANLIFH